MSVPRTWSAHARSLRGLRKHAPILPLWEREENVTEHCQGTILYVDDDEVNRHALTWFFRQAGFAVKEAASGGEALLLAAERPDLVILDVNLPDLNGVEVCRRIKAHPATTAIPVLHLSGVYVSPRDKTQALQKGSDGYLTKPVEPEELLARAKALVRIHQAEERARTAARPWQATGEQSMPVAPAAPSPGQAEPAGEHERGEGTPAVLCRSRLTNAEAEELLDWLEANGCPYVEVGYEEGNGLVVRWRVRAAGERRTQERGSLLVTLWRAVARLLRVCRHFWR
jgi:CheY-like chemotaxis protein